jgi:quinohemoprotein ethanol dehydrogenase
LDIDNSREGILEFPLSKISASLPRLVFAALALGGSIVSLPVGADESAKSARPIANLTTPRLLNAVSEPGEWFTGGRDYRQSYYSPLTGVNRENVATLGFAWSHELDATSNLEGTPLVVDGIMFTSSSEGAVYSLDAKTGDLRWSFRPSIDPDNVHYPFNRGVAIWGGKVYFVAGDGVLYALDGATGSVAWKVDTLIDHSVGYFSTGAPYIAGGVVVIGNAGAESDARGYVTAYDTTTGKQKWRFFTVPADPKHRFEHPELEMAAKTWDKNSLWEVGGGGTAWDGMAYDPKLKLLFVGTGNGIPWNRTLRSPAGGDNLFLASILAINAETGRLAWYYQTTPADAWDYDAAQKFILADLPIGGRTRNVIMQATKNGFFYVLDRATGQLLSAEPYVYVNWASHIDLKSGRPVPTEDGDYSKTPKLVFPAPQGSHNWYPMAYNPGTGLVYIPVLESGALFGATGEPFRYLRKQWNLGVTFLDGEQIASENLPNTWPPLDTLLAGKPDPTPRTFLRAWDPIKQTKVWDVETTIAGNRLSTGNPAGVMTTASGLVFQGQVDGHLLVFDAKTGRQLKSIDVGDRMVAAPMTYRIGGEQYVAILGTHKTQMISTRGDEDGDDPVQGRIVVLKLDGGEIPHPISLDREQAESIPPPVADTGTPEQISLGAQMFGRHCAPCHASENRAPDLTKLNADSHRQFLDIVLKGSRLSRGMPNFSGLLSQTDAQAIHAFVIDRAWKNYHRVADTQPSADAASTANCPALKETDPPVNLLIVTGGHPYDPAEFFAAFGAMPHVRYQHVYMDQGKPVSVPPGGLGQYDVVLFYDLEPETITPEWRDLFDRGHGIVFLHHAIASFPSSPEYAAMVGGRYTFSSDLHPEAPHSEFFPNERQHFTITDRSHPITCALHDFNMLDEAYDDVQVDAGSHLLMTSDFPKHSPAVAWISSYAPKRIVYIQPGHGSIYLPANHGPSSYQNGPFRALIDRAILWTARRL